MSNISDYGNMSIVQLVMSSGVKLRKSGDYYIGRCPFHNDKTPSLVVYPKTNSWTCFGAGCLQPNGKRNSGGKSKWIKLRFGKEVSIKEDLPVLSIKEEKPRLVPDTFVLYWHSLLENREWFYNRGFLDPIIDREMWGWDGSRYTIPVWEGEPGNSNCLGVRKRKPNPLDSEAKYIGLKNMNQPTVWGRWYCQQNLCLAFAGELDAARAIQDGFAAFSLVNGVNSLSRFPETWVEDWFPKPSFLIAVFDRDEEPYAGRLCSQWNKTKGFMTGKVFFWPPKFNIKDYCEFRERFTIDEFKNLLSGQGFGRTFSL